MPRFQSFILGVVALGGVAAAEFRADSARAMEDYQNGDFEKIETALKPILVPGTVCSREDSALAFKFLAVVYAANPATREKGRYCMLRLLDADPAADLIDLFVGEEVDEIFTRTRREHGLARVAAFRSETSRAPAAGDETADTAEAADASIPAGGEASSAIFVTGEGRPRPWLVSTLAAAAVAGMAWYAWENAPPREKVYSAAP